MRNVGRIRRGHSRPRVSRQLVSPARAGVIAELAAAVADEHCPTGRVEPLAIARARGISVSFGEYGEAFDGMLEYADDRFHIYANTEHAGGQAAPRGRFTLAHELGHFYLDEHRHALRAGRAVAHRSVCDHESPILAEQEADHFAANLLMPADRFARQARRVPRGLAGVRMLAERFGTSITSTAIRCANLDVWPCAVVKWSWRGYAWKCLSASTFRAALRSTYESPDDLPADGPTRRALAREEAPEAGYFEAGSVASAWFPRVQLGDWRDAVLIEQAVGLGGFGVLTLLVAESGLYGR